MTIWHTFSNPTTIPITPKKLHGSGRAAYVERNYEMINNSKYCIVYYDEPNAPTTRKSGTKIALDYALKKEQRNYNLS